MVGAYSNNRISYLDSQPGNERRLVLEAIRASKYKYEKELKSDSFKENQKERINIKDDEPKSNEKPLCKSSECIICLTDFED